MQIPLPFEHPGARELERARASCAELGARGGTFAWFALALDRSERIADASLRTALFNTVAGFVRERAKPYAAWRSDARMWWCAPDLDAKEALALARAIVDGARGVRVVHAGASSTVTASVGVAVSRPGLAFEALLAVAEEGLTVARAGGGNRAAHTDLYDLMQRRHTGEALPAIRPAPAPIAHAPATLARDAAGEVEVRRAPVSDQERDERVELLERRIAKLIGALREAEERIASLEHQQAIGGIASDYREVQGLDPLAPAFDVKRRMMTRIFEANLALQRAKYAS